MDELLNSTFFWVGVGLLAIAAVYFINMIFGGLFNARSQEQAKFPHRVATDLPRELHTKDRDEVLELKDETEIQGK